MYLVQRLPSPIRELLTSVGLDHFPLKVERKGNVVVEYLRSPCRVTVGRGSYGHVRIFSWDENATVTVGHYTSIASVTIMLGGGHHYLDVSTYPFKTLFAGEEEESARPRGEVKIGNDVWIARDVFVLDNLSIEDGAILAARSVITHDVPAYALVAGNPAEVKKFRFSEEEIKALRESAWWELPERVIRNNIELFYTGDVKEFLRNIATLKSGMP